MATDMIWTDAEVYNGRGTPSEYGPESGQWLLNHTH